MHASVLSLMLLSGTAVGGAGNVGEICEDEVGYATPAEETREEIIPCAVLDSDHFGPHCAAAKVFIHTNSGVLLCSIMLPPLQLDLREGPELDARPSGSLGSNTLGPHAGLSAELDKLSPPLLAAIQPKFHVKIPLDAPALGQPVPPG